MFEPSAWRAPSAGLTRPRPHSLGAPFFSKLRGADCLARTRTRNASRAPTGRPDRLARARAPYPLDSSVILLCLGASARGRRGEAEENYYHYLLASCNQQPRHPSFEFGGPHAAAPQIRTCAPLPPPPGDRRGPRDFVRARAFVWPAPEVGTLRADFCCPRNQSAMGARPLDQNSARCASERTERRATNASAAPLDVKDKAAERRAH